MVLRPDGRLWNDGKICPILTIIIYKVRIYFYLFLCISIYCLLFVSIHLYSLQFVFLFVSIHNVSIHNISIPKACSLTYSKRLYQIWFPSPSPSEKPALQKGNVDLNNNNNKNENDKKTSNKNKNNNNNQGDHSKEACSSGTITGVDEQGTEVQETTAGFTRGKDYMKLNLERGLQGAKLVLANTNIVSKSC